MDLIDVLFSGKIARLKDDCSITKCGEYLYRADYQRIDYDYAKRYFSSSDAEVVSGACSSVSTDKFYGRNFDWAYDQSAEFVVHVKSGDGRFESHGIAGGIKELTNEFVNSRKKSVKYKLLPFMLLDGQNEYGLICSTNVVPNDYGTNISVPSVEQRDSICGTMLVRYILDHFKTAEEACKYIAEYVSVWFSPSLIAQGYEQHYMLKDSMTTYCLEFVENQAVYYEISAHPYLTNFYMHGLRLNDDNTVYTPYTQDSEHNAMDTNGITENGCGLERWNMIANAYPELSDADSLFSLMRSLRYTNAYTITDAADVWYTEFVHIRNMTAGTPYTDYDEVLEVARSKYEERSRDDQYPIWQTVHTVVYDIVSHKMKVMVQESDTPYEFELSPYATKSYVSAMISEAIAEL